MPTREEMQTAITRELPVGSSSQKIEAFFHKHKLVYGYDHFTNRYDSIVRYDRFDGITITISLDNKGNMQSSDVEGYTTAP